MDKVKSAEAIYSVFRKYYKKHSEVLVNELNKFSYSLLEMVGEDSDITLIWDNSFHKLRVSIKSELIIMLRGLLSYHSFKYSSINGFDGEDISIEVLKDLVDNIDYFVDKFIKSLKNDLHSTILMRKNSYSAVVDILPPDDSKGKYQGRIKTMAYMIGLSAVNKASVIINNTNSFGSEIVDLNNGNTNNLVMEDGLFKIKSKSNPLWRKVKAMKLGENAPSYFGSKEIILPHNLN